MNAYTDELSRTDRNRRGDAVLQPNLQRKACTEAAVDLLRKSRREGGLSAQECAMLACFMQVSGTNANTLSSYVNTVATDPILTR